MSLTLCPGVEETILCERTPTGFRATIAPNTRAAWSVETDSPILTAYAVVHYLYGSVPLSALSLIVKIAFAF